MPVSDRSLGREREQVRRGKTYKPKRDREPARAVYSADGTRVLAVLHGRDITPDDVAQALACLLSAPNRAPEMEALRGQ
ncbi:hypothetical protein JOL79_11585 [Microbispora sp. RL4-1S]|uniref:Uncharacterized protein n=1 Tax=Microbispora oryzae TaxID=2806554 RepID=A0A941AHT9_9ACTN|nr:hypothetical protein [Microbispora oryzae]MBP2704456.1 hypothetical protein [Microbispora oryzae]